MAHNSSLLAQLQQAGVVDTEQTQRLAQHGVEYAVAEGETVFHVGPQDDLANGRAEQLLGDSEAAYFIPADLPSAAFAIRCTADDPGLQLGERSNDQTPWAWRPMTLQRPLQAGGIHFAVREASAEWSADVQTFAAPALPVEYPVDPANARPVPMRRRGAQVRTPPARC